MRLSRMNTDFDVRLGFSCSFGVYLAVHALPDALIIVDGKDRVVQKVEQITAERGVQLVIGNSCALADFAPRIATCELGSPSLHRHALTDQSHG